MGLVPSSYTLQLSIFLFQEAFALGKITTVCDVFCVAWGERLLPLWLDFAQVNLRGQQ